MSTNHICSVFLLLFCCLLLGGAQSQANTVSGVDFSVLVERVDSVRGKKAIFRDTVSPLLGIAALGFWEVASVDLRLSKVDSTGMEFSLQVVMAGLSNSGVAKEYRADYGLPVRLTNLIGQRGRRYNITLVPLAQFAQDTSGCSFSQATADMQIQPTANYRLTAPAGTLPGISLNPIGDQVEAAHEFFQRLIAYRSSFQGIVTLFPCASPSIFWPHDEAVLVDPGRGTIWMQYSIDRNGYDNDAVNRLLILRHDGYRPLPIIEGLARFDSPDEWKTVQRKRAGEAIPEIRAHLEDWTQPVSETVGEASNSFMRFLILRSSIERFRLFADTADEFGIPAQIANFYNTPFESLVAEWGSYLDTVTFLQRQLYLFADRASTAFRFEEARTFLTTVLPITVSMGDSAIARDKLTALSFALGDYASASRYELQRDSLNQAGAGYALMAGDSVTAVRIYAALLAKNERDNGARFGMAQLYLNSGENEKAIVLLKKVTDDPQSSLAQAESRALLGVHLKRLKGKRTAEADTFLVDARRWYEATLAGPQSSPSQYIWYGLTLSGLEDYAAAEQALSIATFLEVRPFYRAMAILWLGKLADLRNQRERAKEFYTTVLSMKAAAYHRREAEQLLKTPFKL